MAVDEAVQVVGAPSPAVGQATQAPDPEEELVLFAEEGCDLPVARRLELEPGRTRWLGRIRVVRVHSWVVYIGPHWYCTVLMLCIIWGVGTLYTVGVAIDLGQTHIAGGFLVTLLTTGAFLRCALSDPGILPARPGSPGGCGTASQFLPSTGRRNCSACGIVQPKGSLHCEFCHVCVAGWDHHCPWMSKCIGAGNVHSFYTFLCVSLGSLAYIVAVTLAGSQAPR